LPAQRRQAAGSPERTGTYLQDNLVPQDLILLGCKDFVINTVLKLSQPLRIEDFEWETEFDDNFPGIELADDVTDQQYGEVMKDVQLPFKVRLMNGKAIIVELPSEIHGRVVSEISGIMRAYDCALPGYVMPGFLARHTGFRQRFGLNVPNQNEPDADMRPRTLQSPPATNGNGVVHPTVVFEFGDSESENSLDSMADIYLSANTTIQGYVSIKLYLDGLLIVFYERNLPNIRVTAWDCGDNRTRQIPAHVPQRVRQALQVFHAQIPRPVSPFCTQHTIGVATYQLRIPAATIFWGVPIPAGAQDLVIDLYNIKVLCV